MTSEGTAPANLDSATGSAPRDAFGFSGWVMCALLVIATGLTYWNSFPGAFHYDDYPLMLQNPYITENFPFTAFLDQYGGRPLTLWTMRQIYHFFGADAGCYHLLSVVLHALSSILLFTLTLRLFGSLELSFMAALLFALHPLQSQTVNYIWSQSVLLMSCFSLAAMILARRRPWAGLFFFQLAVWSRADALAMTPFLIGLNSSRWLLWTAGALVNFAGLVDSMVSYAPAEIAWNHPDATGYWLAQPVVFWKSLGLMFWPLSLNLDHDIGQPERETVILAATVLFGFCALAYWMRRKRPVEVLGLFWILMAYAPSWIIPNSDLFSESRLYLPFAGFSLAVGSLLVGRSDLKSWSWRTWSVTLLLTLLMVPLTLARNEVWKDEVTLWGDAATKSPNKARVHYNLGASLARLGALDRAEASFRRTLEVNPKDDFAYAGLAYCAESRRDLVRARELYRDALRLNSENEYARQGLERLGAEN